MMEAREKLALDEYFYSRWEYENSGTEFARFEKAEKAILSLLGDSHRPVSGSEPEKDLHKELDAERLENERLVRDGEFLTEKIRALEKELNSVPGSGSPHRSEALEIRAPTNRCAHCGKELSWNRIDGDHCRNANCDQCPWYKPPLTSGAPASDGREGALRVCRLLDGFQKEYEFNTRGCKMPGNDLYGDKLMAIVEEARAALTSGAALPGRPGHGWRKLGEDEILQKGDLYGYDSIPAFFDVVDGIAGMHVAGLEDACFPMIAYRPEASPEGGAA